MFDNVRVTAQDALDLIVADKEPLAFGSGLPVYRAAVKKLTRISVPGLITSDLKAVPMDLAFVEFLCSELDRQPSVSRKERARQSDWKSRLRTIARRLEDVPVVRTSQEWEACLAAIRELAVVQGLTEQALIPITSTMRQAAAEEGIEPAEMTIEWLTALFKKAGRKRRRSLQRAAALFDALWADLPLQLRPSQPFGPIEIPPRRRKSHPLPPRIAADLEAYIARRVQGTVLPGLTSEVQVDDGIKADQSTNVYRQAMGWMFDSLCVAGVLTPGDDLEIADLGRLDWLSKIAVEALAHYEAEDGEPSVFPWQPIQPKTIYNRTTSLVLLFGRLCPGFLEQKVEVLDPETIRPSNVDASGLTKLLRAHVSNEMTDAHKAFCRKLVADKDEQRLVLNMHMVCWAEAKTRWQSYDAQSHHDRMQTINLCVLAAILALVVHIPFRARTVTEMLLDGTHPDLALPKGSRRIEFHIAPKRMKVPKVFDAVLEDSNWTRPRQILDWFIKGPRQELLRDPLLLSPKNRRPERLFGGVNTARYNRILVDWTEEVGLRMTTHLFRHALASILINCCEVSLEDVAGLLGNSVATVEQNYVFHDRIRRRGKTIQKLADHRSHLGGTHHPGRRRKE